MLGASSPGARVEEYQKLELHDLAAVYPRGSGALQPDHSTTLDMETRGGANALFANVARSDLVSSRIMWAFSPT